MKHAITIISFIFLTNLIYCQDKVLFHEYSPTASSWNIIRWNLTDTSNVIWILKEVVDEKERVIELEFLKNGKLNGDILCYLPNRVTYNYNDDQIIETLYQDNDEMEATDCEIPYKSIYHLDSLGYILKIETFSKYNFSGMDSTEIRQWKEWVPEYKVQIPDSTQLQINYYYHSYAKMNAIYPVSKNYKLSKDSYYRDEPEISSIKRGVEKLKNKR